MPTQLVPIASDSFARTVSDGWGEADLGGTWVTSGDAAFSVADGRGIQGTSALSVAWLDAISTLDSDTTVRVQADALPLVALMLARVQDAGTWLGLSAQIDSSAGGVILMASVDGSLTTVHSGILTGITIAPDTDVWVRLQIEGTTARGRVWKAGATEPDTWPIETTFATPELQSAGSVGLGSAFATHSFAEFASGTWTDVQVHGTITASQRARASLVPSQRLVAPSSEGQSGAAVTSSTSAATISASQHSAVVH